MATHPTEYTPISSPVPVATLPAGSRLIKVHPKEENVYSKWFGRTFGCCYEASPEPKFERWSYVGPQQGGYELLSSMDFVGDGSGSYTPYEDDLWQQSHQKEVSRPFGAWMCGVTFKTCMLVSVLCLMTIFLVLTAFHFASFFKPRSIEAMRLNFRGQVHDGFNKVSETTGYIGHAAHDAFSDVSTIPAAAGETAQRFARNASAFSMTTGSRAVALAKTLGFPGGPINASDVDNTIDSRAVVTKSLYQCNFGHNNWRRAWTRRKKDWCCHNRQIGCPEDRKGKPYDCATVGENWITWSIPQKDFCCGYRRRMCQSFSTDAPNANRTDNLVQDTRGRILPVGQQRGMTLPQSGDEPVRTLDSPHGNLSALVVPRAHGEKHLNHSSLMQYDQAGSKSSVPGEIKYDLFDCNYGFTHWRLVWSIQKQEWCCDRVGRGCTSPSSN